MPLMPLNAGQDGVHQGGYSALLTSDARSLEGFVKIGIIMPCASLSVGDGIVSISVSNEKGHDCLYTIVPRRVSVRVVSYLFFLSAPADD